MNKYQRAIKRIRNDYLNNHNPDCDVLEELVKRATSKKPNIDYVIDDTYCFCPVCGNIIIEKRMLNTVSSDLFKKSNSFCSQCGQAIDWSEEE